MCVCLCVCMCSLLGFKGNLVGNLTHTLLVWFGVWSDWPGLNDLESLEWMQSDSGTTERSTLMRMYKHACVEASMLHLCYSKYL